MPSSCSTALVLDAQAGARSPDCEPREHHPAPLAPYSPELNPVENIGQYLRQSQLSMRLWDDYDAIVETYCKAWNSLIASPQTIASIASREWAEAVII